ncbi:MAG: GHKL domain-containing protein [Lachnospiraceae bacterium]|nr:GHKL domain-containing protein [Lachnospiraceae bacterium]
MNIIALLNGTAVAIFGMILSASFCDIAWNRKKQIIIVGSMAGLLAVQGIVIYFMEIEAVRLFYPVITHLPLMIILYLFTKQQLWVTASVLTAYLCCQIRRWLALLVTAILGGDAVTQEITELMITIPLLLLLLKYISPAVRTISYNAKWMQSQFCLIPAVYYLFDYATQIYTDLMTEGTPVVAEFMSFVCCIAYLVFILRSSEEKWLRNQLELTQDSLNLQITQAVREIDTLRESQEKTREYRHDMRHHMQYLSACIGNNQLERAQEYIQKICSEIEANKVMVFCENEAANLIFSAFTGRAKEQNVPIIIKAQIPKNIHISESDLCVLLSNALENALHACQNLKEKGIQGKIEVSAFEKNKKLFLQFINSCDSDITFVQGIPVTSQPGHGIGVRSICALVERYEGIYTFEVVEDRFVLRVSM